MAGFLSRVRSTLQHGWNLFRDGDYPDIHSGHHSFGYYASPHRASYSSYATERTIISSIYTRLSIDVAAIEIRHVQLDENSRYVNDRSSGLQDCLTVEANIDQAARQFRQDIAATLFERGVIAIVPVETSLDPSVSTGFDIRSLRVGEIVGWHPEHVRVSLYNERTGMREDVTVPKRQTAVIENPLYSVMNETNSTLKRLTRKLSMLDAADEQSSSGKLDIIIQLPYVIKSEARRQQAEQRRKDLEDQLKGTKYGIAYTDGTEKIHQLNRPAENNLLEQIKYLTDKLYSELGLTPEVMNGTADEKAMVNYYNRTTEPVVEAITEAMKRAFLTKTARSQGQSIEHFRNPFKLIPMAELAEVVDKFTRNEILTSNEIRASIGFRPSTDPKADKLINSNMPQAPELSPASTPTETGGNGQNGS